MDLKFSNNTFHEGENITVRRGTKWSGVSGTVNITDSITAEILYTQTFKFFDLVSFDLLKEHDESCRHYNGLLKEMDRLYKEFDEREIVTIIHFLPNVVQNPERSIAREDASSTKLD